MITFQRRDVVLCFLFSVVLIIINYGISKSSLGYHCNHGIAFGIKLPELVFIVLWCATMLFVLYLLRDAYEAHSSTNKKVGLYLILAGGLANIADRIIHGCVIDYIALVPWNTFNLADTSIFCGAVLVLLNMHNREKRAVQNQKIDE